MYVDLILVHVYSLNIEFNLSDKLSPCNMLKTQSSF
jgi:hypothetical protein